MRPRAAAAVLAASIYALPSLAGEAEVRQVIEDLARLYAPADGATLAFSFSGRARIASQNSVHEVVLPALELRYKGARVQLGDLKLVMREQNDGRIAFQAEMPSELVVRDPDYEELGLITLREPRFSAAFDPGLFAFTAAEFRAAAGEFRLTFDDMNVKFGAIAVTHAAGATSPRSWTTQTSSAASGIEFKRPDLTATIAEITSSHRLVDLDLAAYGALAKANGVDPLVAWPQLGDLTQLSTRLGAVLGGASVGRVEGDVRLSRISARDPAGAGFTAGAFGLDVGLADLAQTRASARLRLKLDQLAIASTVGPGVTPLLPRAAAFDLELKNLPIAALMAWAEQAMALGEEFVDGDPGFMQLLTEGGGLTLKLNPSRIESQTMGVGLNGGFVTDGAAAMGGHGTLMFEIAGLQDTIQRLRQLRNDPQATQAAAFCVLLQSIGRPIGGGTRANGALSFELSLTPAGETLLNGIDIGTLMGMMQGAGR